MADQFIVYLLTPGVYSFPPEGTYKATTIDAAKSVGDDMAARVGGSWADWVQTSERVIWSKDSLDVPGQRIVAEFYQNPTTGRIYA